MRRLIPKTYLKWSEPAALARERAKTESETMGHWGRFVLAGVLAGMLLVGWGLARLNQALGNPKANPPPFWIALSMSAGAGLGLAYLATWLDRKSGGRRVLVTDRGIICAKGHAVSNWKYADMRGCELAEREADGEKVSVLVVVGDRPAPATIGIAANIPIADLRRILSEHGVIVRDRDPKEAPLYTMAEIPMPLRRRLWLNGMIRLVIFFVVLPTLMFIPITTAVVIAVVCMLMGLHLDRDQFGWLLLGTLAAWSGMLYFADCRYRALKRYSACLGRWLPTSVEEAVEQRLTAGGRDQEEVAERVDRHQS